MIYKISYVLELIYRKKKKISGNTFIKTSEEKVLKYNEE